MIVSEVRRGRSVPFPEFLRERIYMVGFQQGEPLPHQYARWQPTVDAMLDGVQAQGPIYLMVDQAIVRRGQCHRRPGPHVDGRWVELDGRHDHETAPVRERHQAQALLLASDQPGACGWLGKTEGVPAADGSCDHLDLSAMEVFDLKPGVVWQSDASQFVHASVPAQHECFRTLVRLNVSGWLPHNMG